MTNAETESIAIPAQSERQAMDWSLVLASQDIPTAIDRAEEGHWVLMVEARDHERALHSIRLYRLENRRWAWRQQLPWSDITFHWGGLIWCVLLVFIYRLSAIEFPFLPEVARFDSLAVSQGEWWRSFTAILLHADLAHLLTNTATGVVLFGLAMARYGAGWGLLAAHLAGAAGNFAGLLLYPKPYQGLGASGMVMGALGLIAVPALSDWRGTGGAFKQLLRSALAGLLLFVILGTNPSSDIVAHAGGFVAGVIFGCLLSLLPNAALQGRFAIGGSWLMFVSLLTLTAVLAVWHQ